MRVMLQASDGALVRVPLAWEDTFVRAGWRDVDGHAQDPSRIVLDVEAVREHQPRERAALCSWCLLRTWAVHGVCGDCLAAHPGLVSCTCAEVVRAVAAGSRRAVAA